MELGPNHELDYDEVLQTTYNSENNLDIKYSLL
jgi:hypothetical protein